MSNKDAVLVLDTSEWDKYFKLLMEISGSEFKRQIAEWFEGCGFEFLSIVQDEIIRKKVMDTRLLLNSFEKGNKENIWKVKDGGLTLEVGTNVTYAQFVNDGHWTVEKGKNARFVPGIWRNGKFEYRKGAKTGMVLYQKWVEGSHYWESAIRIFERIFQESIERKMEQWAKDLQHTKWAKQVL